VRSTEKSAVDINRSFAHARDEITVLNVLRAAERQPLQFSTISSVQGSLRADSTLRIPFVNIIAGGTDAISPELTFSSRGPTVSITPLATKEFVQGMARPLSPTVISDLLAQGWSREVVLSLVIGGVICSDGSVRINGGGDPSQDRNFLAAMRNATGFTVQPKPPARFARLVMSSRDALTFLAQGVGEGRRIQSITPLPPKPDGSSDAAVEIVYPSQIELAGIDFSAICAVPTAANEPSAAVARSPDLVVPAGINGVLMRSVFGIFQYLGKAHAANPLQHSADCRQAPSGSRTGPRLFDLRQSCGPLRSGRAVVDTEFHGRHFSIEPAAASDPDDHTLDTLSLLTLLVDLQTSEAAVKSSLPFVAITR
jgi:hypothetical protein